VKRTAAVCVALGLIRFGRAVSPSMLRLMTIDDEAIPFGMAALHDGRAI
jgi:hypothetical protein